MAISQKTDHVAVTQLLELLPDFCPDIVVVRVLYS